MLTVVSDLHFAEERSMALDPEGSHRPGGSRNLSPRAFERFFAALAESARRDGARRLDLVLAGDVFDLHRTGLWFCGSARPYQRSDPDLEGTARRILDAIAQEPPVEGSLAAIRRFARGRYLDGEREREFPVPVGVHYIPGNHDRLVNLFPSLRRRARDLLGLEGGEERFPNVLEFQRERVLVRHGHEYDRYNYSHDLARTAPKKVPTHLPEAWYDGPAFGDLVTVEVAMRLPWLFRERYGLDRIAERPDLRAVYARLLAFDDVRPQSALPEYLLTPRGLAGVTRGRVWRVVEPVVRRLLDELAEDPEMVRWLKRLDRRWRPDVIDLVQAVFALRAWRSGIPLRVMDTLLGAWRKRGPAGPRPAEMAAREQAVRDGWARLVVAGHTHRPGVEALPARGREEERLYVDTGTWRRRVLAAAGGENFVELKAVAWVSIYAPDEDPGREAAAAKEVSFDFWDGLTRRFFARLARGGGA